MRAVPLPVDLRPALLRALPLRAVVFFRAVVLRTAGLRAVVFFRAVVLRTAGLRAVAFFRPPPARLRPAAFLPPPAVPPVAGIGGVGEPGCGAGHIEPGSCCP